ncbi:MAG: N-acetyltransferase [Cyclobacteriaceae bacterium]|nr:N-acetyltransferase [Cyclobacteriaceae bacterium]MDH4297451.1 N-acetyltransferase [Cyclobacteriaceae bacterium]MDH5250672.1 N-acetyltransferase [Cyclobacteriaceae bacterium]
MEGIQLKLAGNGRGAFVYEEGDEQLAEMEIAISGKNLIVYHTEVAPQLQGKGVSSSLLATMVEYARQHALKVVALCPYVLSQFNRNPEKYNTIWNRDWKQN